MEQNYSRDELFMIEWARMKAEYDYNTQTAKPRVEQKNARISLIL